MSAEEILEVSRIRRGVEQHDAYFFELRGMLTKATEKLDQQIQAQHQQGLIQAAHETKIAAMYGNGQPGSIAVLDARVNGLEKKFYRVLGALALANALLIALGQFLPKLWR